MSAVRFVDVPNMIRWVSDRGAEAIIAEMAAVVEADFGRWREFEKTPRVASHSPSGVIELMPTSDGADLRLQVRQRASEQPARGPADGDRVRRARRRRHRLPACSLAEMTILTALRTAATSAMAARYLAPPGLAR